jgi:hypothetical protein
VVEEKEARGSNGIRRRVMNKQQFEAIIENYHQRLSKDEQIDDVIADLHTDGLTITDAMKVVMILYRIPLGAAKKLVTAHPAWSLVVQANEPFHEELEHFAEAWSNNLLTDFNAEMSM